MNIIMRINTKNIKIISKKIIIQIIIIQKIIIIIFNNYEIAREVSEYDRRSKIINVEKLPNEEPIDNYQYNLNNQEIPLINNNNNNYETNQYICNEFEINKNNDYNINNNINNTNYNNNYNFYQKNFQAPNNQQENYNNIINYEVPNNNIDNIHIYNSINQTNHHNQIYSGVNYKTKINNTNKINKPIATVKKIITTDNDEYNGQNNNKEKNNINSIKYNNAIIEQQKLKDNLIDKNKKNNKNKIIINSKLKNRNKFIYKTEEEKNNNENIIKDKEPLDKIKSPKRKKQKSEFEIRRENDINYDIKSNYNTNQNYGKNIEMNREISLDYSNISSDKKSKSKSKETPRKQNLYEMSNVNKFTIEKTKSPKNSNKKTEIITNINNFSKEKEVKNETKLNKNTKKNKSNDKKKKKDKSKPKFNFQINIKDLINQNIKEKNKITPNKRYADIEMKRRAINKKDDDESKYNKPFRFNMNDDY